MSFWLYKKDSVGRKHWWIIDTEPMILLVIIGLFLSLVGPGFIFCIPYGLMIIGFILLIIAKVSLFRRGIWHSFGFKLMDQTHARLYKLSYTLMIFGVMAMILLIIKLKIKAT
jgi:hypothetical protein